MKVKLISLDFLDDMRRDRLSYLIGRIGTIQGRSKKTNTSIVNFDGAFLEIPNTHYSHVGV